MGTLGQHRDANTLSFDGDPAGLGVNLTFWDDDLEKLLFVCSLPKSTTVPVARVAHWYLVLLILHLRKIVLVHPRLGAVSS